jgi:hypothetical protein
VNWADGQAVADTCSDYDMALKFFLRASEMETDPEHKESNKTRTRTWWGVKLVSGAGVQGDATLNADRIVDTEITRTKKPSQD